MVAEKNFIERRAALLHAATRVGQAVASILDVGELLRQTVDIICDEYDFYYSGVFLLDEDKKWAVLHAGHGDAGQRMLDQEHKLEVGGNSMIGAATGNREARIALDVGKEAVRFDNPLLPLTRSEMALPLIVANEVIGALTVQSVDEAAFSEEDISSLQAMANHLAIAIKNARTYEQNIKLLAQSKRHARLLEAGARVGKVVTTIWDLDELLAQAVDIICDEYGFYYSGVFLLDEDKKWAVLRAGRGDAGQRMLDQGHRLEVGGNSMIGAATGNREARIALDVGKEAVRFNNPLLPLTRSEMALPLVVADEVIGALTVQSVEEAAFSDDDIKSLQAMADQIAVAIKNARLLFRLEEAHRELLRTKTFEAIATSTSEAIHWIGNKATPLLGCVDRIRHDISNVEMSAEVRESVQEDLQLISDSARLILMVKENLIGPAREHKPRPVMLPDIIKDTVTTMGISSDIVEYHWPEHIPLALTDSTQMHRVFKNLLQNALEAMEDVEDKHIIIDMQPDSAGDVAISITDSGCGIPAARMDDIWVTFYTTKGTMKHPGLGLSACLQILWQMEGRISAQSEEGKGATFTVVLPVWEEPERGTEKICKGQLLIVDDDDLWCHFAANSLKEIGCQVTTATAGADYGLAQLAEQLPDFDRIFVDDTLERANTLTILEKLRDAGVAERTMVMASNLQVERAKDEMKKGINDVLLKPYTLDDLLAIVA